MKVLPLLVFLLGCNTTNNYYLTPDGGADTEPPLTTLFWETCGNGMVEDDEECEGDIDGDGVLTCGEYVREGDPNIDLPRSARIIEDNPVGCRPYCVIDDSGCREDPVLVQHSPSSPDASSQPWIDAL